MKLTPVTVKRHAAAVKDAEGSLQAQGAGRTPWSIAISLRWTSGLLQFSIVLLPLTHTTKCC
jgi:hypothetical protein